MGKTLRFSVLILSLTFLHAWSADNNDRLLWIKQEYKTIRGNLSNYKKYESSFSGESAEGARAVAYGPGKDEIKLIEVTYFGEMGKTEYEFYYSDGQAFFILEKNYTYNTHIMVTEEMAREWAEEDGIKPEVFDPDKTKLEEWRYYFDGDTAVRILNPENNEVANPEKSRNALDASKRNLARFIKS